MPTNHDREADRGAAAPGESPESDDRLIEAAKRLGSDKDSRPSSPAGDSTETLKDSITRGRMPKEIGRYHVKRVIASGGMGMVYEAVQEHPRRTVAVKVMRRGIASRSAMRRFEYESQILARLRHPGIAQVYEAGTHTPSPSEGEGWGEGQLEPVPFFAMEYIPNAKPITKYATEKKLGTRERLGLFGKVCDAVHHGHQKGIIHRDLKPSNILVDSHGQPTRLRTIDRALRGDGETIVFKALEQDRDHRYRSAAELADGIDRYLTGEAIVARPPSIVHQLRVFARRNKAFFRAVCKWRARVHTTPDQHGGMSRQVWSMPPVARGIR